MSTENIESKDTGIPLDTSMQQLYSFLPDSEKGGESPTDNNPEEKQEDPNPAAEGEGGAPEEKQETPEGSPDKSNSSFDLNKYLEESSGGLFKSEEEFKSSISKIKDYDDLAKQIEVLKSEKETIFANDSIRKLNDLYKAGKSQEQIDSYMNLSKMDLGSIDPKEALIQHEILNHGHTRGLAERLVNKRFGLDKFSIPEDDLSPEEIAQRKEDLEVVNAEIASAAKPVIEQFKKELEGIESSISPEQKALDEEARKKSYVKALEPFAEKLAGDFPKQVVLQVEDEVKLAYDVPEEIIASIKDEAIEYFNHPDLEVNAETVNEFITLKKALFLYTKGQEISKHFYEQGKAQGKKEALAEFENRGGLDRPNADIVPTDNENIEDRLIALSKQ